ncbi:FtsK/SpoIIIE domain-containing protein [Sinomonas albida]|uniref:FtsK/SpoIIIE domain-containing protein n=1 Tax=Sinomonas albida TaxID=369942 RepID=UPI00301A9029
MELHFTLVAPHRERRATYELVAAIPRGASGTELAGELDRLFGAEGIMVEGRPLAELTVGSPPLRNGAILLAGEAARTPHRSDPPLVLGVRSGPAAGSVFALPRGVHTVGRGPEAQRGTISLPDPELSREHARLAVTEASVRLLDTGSGNGTAVGGRRIRAATVVTGQLLRFGSSTGSLEVSGGSPLHATAGRPHGEPLRVARPDRGRPRLALLAMATVPLVLGVGMAALTGQWMFLGMSGVSAAAALLPLAEGRRARRTFAQELTKAVGDDLARRLRAAPDAYEISTQTAGSRGDPEDVVMLRVGTGTRPADVVVEASHESLVREHGSVPVVVPFDGLVTLRGPRRNAEGLVRFLLLQLASLPAASGLTTVLAGGPLELRLAARFLPRVRVLTDAECADTACVKAALTADARCGVLVLPGLKPAASAAIVEAALALERPVVNAAGAVDRQGLEIDLGSSPALLRSPGSESNVVADLVPPRAFATAARHLGSLGETDDGGALPRRCLLSDVVGLTEHDIAEAWARETATDSSMPVPLGLTQSGPLILDLAADGPHVLIAGTTGSGKSELLRSLVASAAASHSPRRLTFLFVDFKGGSGLEPLTGLPHCVGLISDLAGQIDRTLISLRAEVVRRERILAESGCADIIDYQRMSSGERAHLPRLALVIDEFRMLVDENPEALAEFLRIASIGRSLGLHLIMATQRPQGAVSADIRANVGSVIALRVVGEAESRDVIGSPRAASLPAEAPGRALLARGTRDPVEFQTASLGLAGEAARRRPLCVMEADQWLKGRPLPGDDSVPPTPAESAAGFVEAVRRAWEADGGRLPRRPLADPLPQMPGSPSPDPGPSVNLGIADLPHEQRTAVLDWTPETQGHLAFVGDPSAGCGRALAAVVSRLAAAERSRYLYLLDADGSLARLCGHPRVGAYLRPDELRDAARLIARLAEEVSSRHGSDDPTLILGISGWGSWIAALRSNAYSATEDALIDIIRRGPTRRVVIVLSGSRDLVASRAFSELPSRLFFPWGTTEEARLGWPRAIGSVAPGRAIATGAISGERHVAVQCFDALPADQPEPSGLGAPPFRIRRLPTEVIAAQISGPETCGNPRTISLPTSVGQAPDPPVPTSVDQAPDVPVPNGVGQAPDVPVPNGIGQTPGTPAPTGVGQNPEPSLAPGTSPGRPSVLWLAVGIRGDDGETLAVPLAPQEVLLVVGTRQCGKTSFLNALPAMNRGAARWYRPDPKGAAGARGSSEAIASLEASVLAAARDSRAGQRAVLLIDDADHLTAKENRLLNEALDAGASVVATAGYSASLYRTCPISLRARDARSGIAIHPRSSSDGDVFGVRLDPPGRVPPGRAIAVVDGTATDVQLGWLGKDRTSQSG